MAHGSTNSHAEPSSNSSPAVSVPLDSTASPAISSTANTRHTSLSAVTCFRCGQLGHYAHTCPQRKRVKQERVRQSFVCVLGCTECRTTPCLQLSLLLFLDSSQSPLSLSNAQRTTLIVAVTYATPPPLSEEPFE